MPSSRPQNRNRRRYADDLEDDDSDFEASSPGVSPVVKGLLAFAVVFVVLGGVVAVSYGAWTMLHDRPADPVARSDAGAGERAEAPAKPRGPANGGKPAAGRGKPAGERGKPAVDHDTLSLVKAATVFIKAETDEYLASGSGFVMKTEDDTVWIVTNDHVVAPPPERQQPWGNLPRPPFGGGLRPPLGPRGGLPFGPRDGLPIGPFGPGGGAPFGPHNPFGPGGGLPMGPRDGFPANPFQPQQPQKRVKYSVVFYSGTPQEQTLSAEVIGATKEPDLAILRVRGMEQPPEPLDLGKGVQAQESMAVLFLGFPFGAKVVLDKGSNPAVSVKPATVSSISQNRMGNVAVEFEGDVNPGNSGGPLVDTAGRLIGIVFAKFVDTQIGLAVHAADLDKVLQPRIGTMSVSAQTINGSSFMRMDVDVSDPMDMLPEISFHYVLGEMVKVKAHPRTQWEPLPGAKQMTMKRRGLKASITLAGDAAKLGQQKFVYQFSYRDRNGQIRYSEPRGFNQK